MKAFKIIVKLIYTLLEAAAVGFLIYTVVSNPALGVPDYLLAHGICLVVALPGIFRLALRFTKKIKKLGNRVPAVTVVFLFGAAISPALLVIFVVARTVSLIRLILSNEMSPEEREEFEKDEKRKIYLRSSAIAISKLLDESDNGDITLDNGEQILTLRQVALITCDGKRYALLSPRFPEDGIPENTALAYAIDIYPDTDEEALIPVSDGALYRRIFSIYERLLSGGSKR